MMCEKCGCETERKVGSIHIHLLCNTCYEKWGKYLNRERHQKLHGIQGKKEFHTLWESYMKAFILNKLEPEKVQFT